MIGSTKLSDQPPAQTLNRRQALLASVEVFAERGYSRTELPDLLARASTDKATFEAIVGDKEQCFLAAYALLVAEATDRIAASASGHSSWPAQIAAGLSALLKVLDERPAAARMVFIEAKTVSSEAIARYMSTVRSAADFIRGGQVQTMEPIPPKVPLMLAGGIAFMIAQHLRQRPGQPVASLYPEALRCLLLPYLPKSETDELLASAA